MFNKFELIGAGISVFFMALAIYLVQIDNALFRGGASQPAQAIEAKPAVKIVTAQGGENEIRTDAYLKAVDNNGDFDRMVIDDIKIGTGPEVVAGDTVAVHYVGNLQGGSEFDNSRKRGQPFEFKVGKGMVIEGWDKGLLGMKVGGQRALVIPPEMGYGEQGIGPIPGNATLVFMIELVEIK